MISATNLEKYSKLSVNQLKFIALSSGYYECNFKQAKFLGLNSVGQFVYRVSFFDTYSGESKSAKVFVRVAGEDGASMEF